MSAFPTTTGTGTGTAGTTAPAASSPPSSYGSS